MSTHVVSGEAAVILLIYRVLGNQLEHCVQFAGYISGKMWTMGRCQRRTGRTIVDLESITSKQGGGWVGDEACNKTQVLVTKSLSFALAIKSGQNNSGT